MSFFFFFQAEDGIRDLYVTGVQTCALPILQALEAAGHPVITIDVPDAYDLGAEFLRWEIATATAGALLGVNPFDEPNVQEAKDATAAILAQGSLDPDVSDETLTP